MRKVLFFAWCICVPIFLIAQPEVCKRNYTVKLDEGIALYKKGDYRNAARTFKSAHCPSLTATQHAGLDDWAMRCARGINAEKVKTAVGGNKVTQKPKEKPEVEILYSGYLRATCSEGIRGAELAVLVTAKNLRGNKMIIRCIISPQDGDGKVNNSSSLASMYTVGDGLSGQEQDLVYGDGEECATTTIFVPFSVMNLSGNYSPQSMKADMYVYLPNDNNIVAEHHQVYNELSPHTITLEKRTDDFNIDVDFLGGFRKLGPAVCTGNKIIWDGLPSWATTDNEGIHIMENASSEDRSATIRVSSSEGGNVINVTINQKGRKEGQTAIAKINKVWLENNYGYSGNGAGRCKIHVNCEVSGARGKEIRFYAVFFCSDGKTPLRLPSGNELKCSARALADYTESAFDDVPISISYSSLSSAENCSDRKAVYYIRVSDDKGQSWIAQSGPYVITW